MKFSLKYFYICSPLTSGSMSISADCTVLHCVTQCVYRTVSYRKNVKRNGFKDIGTALLYSCQPFRCRSCFDKCRDKITFHFQIILLIFPTQLRLTVAGLWHVSPLAPLLGCLSAALSSNSSCWLAYPALSLVQNALSLSTQLISLTSHWS